MKVNLSIFSSKKAVSFLLKVSVFFALLVAVDFGIGGAVSELYRRAPHGANWTKENWLLDGHFDVVVFGSSRALRHYVPSVIEKETGLSVFNAGQNGQYMLYAYGLEQLLLSRYSPKMIVLDVLPSFIIKADNPEEEFERLSTLSPFIDNSSVKQLLVGDRFFEGLKYASRMYRYNSKILSILENFRSPPNNVDNGYDSVGDVRFHDRNPFIVDLLQKVEVDSFKLGILRRFIRSARSKNIFVVAVFSPISGPLSKRSTNVVKMYSEFFVENKTPFLNYSTPDFRRYWNKNLFIDIIHMDETGADMFSREFAEQLLQVQNRTASGFAAQCRSLQLSAKGIQPQP